MAIDFKTFSSIINPILNAKFPVLVRGRHGIGKSTIVYQKAEELGLPVVEPNSFPAFAIFSKTFSSG